MKACPTCKRTYADESLTFCLIDGAILSAPYDPHETMRIPAPRGTDPAPTEILNPPPPDVRPSPLSTIQSPTPLYTAKPPPPRAAKQSRIPLLAIGIVISLALIVVAGAMLSIIWLAKDQTPDYPPERKVPNANLSPTATPTAMPTATIAGVVWGMRNDNASLNGTNLTYYPGTTPEQCQADCEREKRCKGYTFIRAGAYNPNDSAMCYQASVVTEMVTHPCCISAVKQ
jgi:hypothetical protein